MPIRGIPLAQIPPAHPAAAFWRFWERAAEGRHWAPWSRFDPVDHPAILPWVLLLKAEPAEADGVRWRYAVCGTGCTEMFGLSYQGKLFGTGIPAAAAAERRAEFDRVVAGSGPLFSDSHLPIPTREFVRVLRGVFPFSSGLLASGEGTIDRLFLVIAREDTRVP